MLLILGLTAGAVSSSWAQLSGSSYTINNAAAASSTNFTSWSSFVSALNASGVSGPVKVTVQTNETMSSQLAFGVISGASSTNTITIDGNGKTLGITCNYAAVLLNGTDYLSISNLTIQQNSTSTSAWVLQFYNNANYNTFDACTLEFPNLSTGSTAGGAYVALSGSTTSVTSTPSTYSGQYNTVQNCLMRTKSGSPGPTFGIIDRGGSGQYSSTPSNNTFFKNTIENFYYMGIYNYYTNGNQFIQNEISRDNSGTSNNYSVLYGIYSYYTYSTNRSTKYDGNTLRDLPYKNASSGYTSTVYGMYAYY
ncbi:MAG: hypothetical protein ACO3GK_07685, partial [Bacteroidia bacterium]